MQVSSSTITYLTAVAVVDYDSYTDDDEEDDDDDDDDDDGNVDAERRARPCDNLPCGDGFSCLDDYWLPEGESFRCYCTSDDFKNIQETINKPCYNTGVNLFLYKNISSLLYIHDTSGY